MNIEEIDKWLKKEEGISYTELGKEFKDAVELFSNCAKKLQEKSKEIKRLNNIINDIDRYIHNWRLEDIGEKTMLILNDILLIKNGMSDEVIRLKGEDKE